MRQREIVRPEAERERERRRRDAPGSRGLFCKFVGADVVAASHAGEEAVRCATPPAAKSAKLWHMFSILCCHHLPDAAKFTINNDSITNFNISTLSEDSLRSDESLHLLLGQINDPVFGENKGAFVTQMLLPANNIEEIQDVVVDSVFITYSYTDFYGDLNESNDLDISVFKLEEDIFKDSVYSVSYTHLTLPTILLV